MVLVDYTKFHPKQSNYVRSSRTQKQRDYRLQINLFYFIIVINYIFLIYF